MKRQPGERWKCEACAKPLVGALTKNNAVAPIEVEPDERGNVLLHRREGVVCALTLPKALIEPLRDGGVELRLNHFAFCPEAERFARRPAP